MVMTAGWRRFALTLHIGASVGSLGAIACFLVLAIIGFRSDAIKHPGIYGALQLMAWRIIMPLIVAALVTGLVQALCTKWGLFRHYWVVIKLVVTAFVAVVLALQLDLISYLADQALAGNFSTSETRALRLSLIVHAAAGLAVLLIPLALSVYKPKGLTRYGWRVRRQYENL